MLVGSLETKTLEIKTLETKAPKSSEMLVAFQTRLPVTVVFSAGWPLRRAEKFKPSSSRPGAVA